jgi:hypothetical protein
MMGRQAGDQSQLFYLFNLERSAKRSNFGWINHSIVMRLSGLCLVAMKTQRCCKRLPW